VWDDLIADGRAQCPVCAGAMDVMAGCADCGAELS